jgi:hypothetical protein
MAPLHEESTDDVLVLNQSIETSNCRYILSRAYNFMNSGQPDISMELFGVAMSLSLELGDKEIGGHGLVGLILSMNKMNDSRMFRWYRYLQPSFNLEHYETATVNWCLCSTVCNWFIPFKRVIGYYDAYQINLKHYQDECENGGAYSSPFPMVNDKRYIMNADFFIIYAALYSNDIDKELFDKVLDRINYIDLEVYGDKLLNSWVYGSNLLGNYERNLKALPLILRKCSPAIISKWFENAKDKYLNEGLDGDENYNRFTRYIIVAGMFAEDYYADRLLDDSKVSTVPDNVQAIYRMYLVIADPKLNSENVTLLKHALELYPQFHEEVKTILSRLH